MIVCLLIADTLKASAPGFAGGLAKTPTLDQLAGQGTWFENFFPAGAWTIPSIMAMVTGTLAHKVGVCRWRHPFPAHRPTLQTAFADAGFETHTFHPYPNWGFLTFPGKGPVGNSQDIDAVEKALRPEPGKNKLVMALHWWTHLPYIPRMLTQKNWHAACDFSLDSLSKHPERIARKLESNFLASVANFSENVLPRYIEAAESGGEEVLFIITGDHGETWGRALPEGRNVEIIYDLHGRWIDDETIQTPLVFYGKGANHGHRIGGLASGLDLAPTICELAGIDWPGHVPETLEPGMIDRGDQDLGIIGQSLAGCIRDGSDAPRSEVITVSSHNCHQPKTYPEKGPDMWRTMALRNEQAWYIWDGVAKERTVKPVGDASVEESDEIFTRLESLRQEAVDSAPMVDGEEVDDLRSEDPPVARKLRSLGYLE
jgi:Sulfatase